MTQTPQTPLFRTPVEISHSPRAISYNTPVTFAGSCFTENIGDRLHTLKFPCDINPFGILYNPISIHKGLQRLIQGKAFTADDLQHGNDLWFSYHHHGRFSHHYQTTCLQNINARLSSSATLLKKARYLFITLGTARVFALKETGQVVANCHKQPAALFDHYLLGVDAVTQACTNLVDALSSYNPQLEIVFTVSPIRHWKDGASGNQLSKSTLIVAVHQLVERYDQVAYFPAYEIVMDELRDYRFYAGDMLHLDPVAVDYIWQHFAESYINEEDLEISQQVGKLLKAAQHQPDDVESPGHQTFLERQLATIDQLENKHPFLALSAERQLFQSRKTVG